MSSWTNPIARIEACGNPFPEAHPKVDCRLLFRTEQPASPLLPRPPAFHPQPRFAVRLPRGRHDEKEVLLKEDGPPLWNLTFSHGLDRCGIFLKATRQRQ